MKIFYCILLALTILSIFLQPEKNVLEKWLLVEVLLAFVDIENLREENKKILAYMDIKELEKNE